MPVRKKSKGKKYQPVKGNGFVITEPCFKPGHPKAFAVEVTVLPTISGTCALALSAALAELRKRHPKTRFQVIPHTTTHTEVVRDGKRVTMSTVEQFLLIAR